MRFFSFFCFPFSRLDFLFFSSSLSEMNLYVNSAAKDNIITLAKSSSLLFLHLGGGVGGGGVNRRMDLIRKLFSDTLRI